MARAGRVLTYARKASAASLFAEFFRATAEWISGEYCCWGICHEWPRLKEGETTRDSARIPIWALPDWTNCAACEIFSPKTSFAFTLSCRPDFLRASTAARP